MLEYIERMKVISAIKGYQIGNCPEYMQDWVTKLKRAILQDIADNVIKIPAADVVEVRHGEWIITEEALETIRECSCCHCKTYYPKPVRFNCRKSPYCEDCGAKMDGKSLEQEEG